MVSFYVENQAGTWGHEEAQQGLAHLKGFLQDGVILASDQVPTATVTKGNCRAQALEGTS